MAQNDVKGILALARPRRGLTALAVVCTLIATASGVLYPRFTQVLIDSIGSGEDPFRYIAALALILGIGAVVSAINVRVLGTLGQKAVRDIRRVLFGRLVSAPVSSLEMQHAAEPANRLVSDTKIIGDFVSLHIAAAFGSVITLLFSIVLLLLIDLTLSVLLLACIVVSFLLIFPLSLKMSGISRSIQEGEGRVMGRLAEVFLNLRLVKASSAENQEKTLFHAASGDLYARNMKSVVLNALLNPIVDMAISFTLVVVLSAGALRVAAGGISLGALIAYILYLFNVALPVTQLGLFTAEYNKAQGAAGRLVELQRLPQEKGDAGRACPGLGSGIALKDLEFSYPGRTEPVLTVEDLQFPDRSTTALVGTSGCGKSTLLLLLDRLYEARGLYLDGTPASDYALADWRRRVAFVPQNAPVLAGSLRFNLCYGQDKEPGDAELLSILDQVQLKDLANGPDGLDALIGEQGLNISGGQRQRLAIARAFLRNPELLLLDEATSALDSHTEKQVQAALLPLMQRCTTVIAAHRLSTVLAADRIVMLDAGRILDMDRHERLLDRCPQYARLVRDQLSVESSLAGAV